MAKKKRPETDDKPREKGKDRGARGSGHFVTIHEGGESHAVWIKGPAPRGMSHAGRPKGLATAGHRRGMETRGRDAAQRADFISGGHVTGRAKATAAAGKEATRLRTAREAHNAGVRAKAGAAHVAGQVKGRQQGFRAKVAAAKAGRAKPVELKSVTRERLEQGKYHKTSSAENRATIAQNFRTAHRRKVSDRQYEAGRKEAQKDFAEKWAAKAAAHKPVSGADAQLRVDAARTLAAKPAPPVRPAGYPYPSQGTSTSSLGRQSSSYGSHGAARKAEREGKLAAAVAMLKEQRAAAAKPSLREQVERHRAGKGEAAWRARELLGRAQKQFRKARVNARRNISAGDPGRAAKHTRRAEVIASRMERLAAPASGARWVN